MVKLAISQGIPSYQIPEHLMHNVNPQVASRASIPPSRGYSKLCAIPDHDVLECRSSTVHAFPSAPGWIELILILGLFFQKAMCIFPRQDQSVHYCIERRAMVALDSQKVPRSILLSLFAIVARNVDHPSQLGRHRLQGHSCRHGIPGGHHAVSGFRRLFADRAP